ncbi:MAG: AAA family ATPase [Candidatus Buchananbacteria bacterium]
MYLERLEIQGFKSFAKRTVLVFPKGGTSKGVTSVVGPNGSGKSNVADAIRWVLGEQSMKTIRGKKLQDVIFFGSDKKSQQGMAEVTMSFNNEDGSTPIDYQEVQISRRVYRSGESEYLINNQQVRLQDVLILLAKANFGQRSYSVVGQGMVDQILNLTGADRKAFFDEAAGIRQYQIKRDQAMNKFKTTRENLVQTDLTLKELEPHLKSLTRQVKKLERRQEVESELRGLQEQYYSWQYYNLHQEKTKFLAEFQQVEQEKLKKQKELELAQGQLDEWEKEESRPEAFVKLQREYEGLVERKSSLREQESRIKNKLEIFKIKNTPATEAWTIAEVLEKLEEVLQHHDNLSQKIQNITNEQWEEFKNDFLVLVERFKALVTEVKNPKSKKVQPLDETLVAELQKVSAELIVTSQQIGELQQKIADFNAVEEKKKSKFFGLQKDLQQRQLELHQLMNGSNDLRVSLTRVETREDDLVNEMKNEIPEALLEKIKGQTKAPTAVAEDMVWQVKRLRSQLEQIGGIDEEVQKEYEETKTRYDFLFTQYTDLTQALESLEKVIVELDQIIKLQFDEAIAKINEGFGKYFKTLFNGGQAELRKVKREVKPEDDDFEEEIENETEGTLTDNVSLAEKKLNELQDKYAYEDIEIYACPPGKRVKNISMLSGGERALTALALICGIISNNPAPFIVLDEVDAALDEANSERFALIVEELSQKSQFIVITHNRATMHKASILYGVTMGSDGISNLLSLQIEEGEQYANRR